MSSKRIFDELYSRTDFAYMGKCVSSDEEYTEWRRQFSRLSVWRAPRFVPRLASEVIGEEVIERLLYQVLGISQPSGS